MTNLTDEIIDLLNEKLISERTCLRYLFVKGEMTYLRSIKQYKLVVADPFIDNTDDMTIPMIYSTMHSSTARAISNKAAREQRASGGGGRTSWGGGGGGFSGGGFGGGVR